MIFLQIIVNSAANDTVSTVTNVASSNGVLLMLEALILPLIVLAVFALVKYFVAVGVDEIDFIDLFAEMAIDLLSIFSSFIIGRFLLETNTQSQFLTACKIIGGMAFCAILLCFFRRKVHSLRNTNYSGNKIRNLILGEYFVDIVCLLLIVIFL